MTHENPNPSTREESLQYITYSAKELLYQLNLRVEALDTKLDTVVVDLAKLDSLYLTRREFAEAQRESLINRRFALASIISSVGALGTFIGLWVNSL